MTTETPAPGFDPSRDVVLDARNLRGLAHPLRVRIIGLLREEGPATATMLGRRLGESSAATSYHLRQLAEYGFIDEDAELGSGRERWWRARHRTTYFDPAKQVSLEGALLTAEYLRSIVRAYAGRMEAWIDALPTAPDGWRDAGTMSDYRMLLTVEQARALVDKLDEIGRSHPADADEPADPEARSVNFQFQVLPNPRALAAEANRG
jgi:DNA-binding transcriptional ArsR family regulator